MKDKYKISPFYNNNFNKNKLGLYTTPGTDIFEFGVHVGGTILELIDGCEKYSSFRKCFGFDSFIGLPNEQDDVPRYEHWHVGAFSSKKDIGGQTVEETMELLLQKLNHPNIVLVPGFYEFLSKDTIQKYDIRPAGLIHIDCDLYISAFQALDFCFANNLVIPGTIIAYDDWGNPDMENPLFAEFQYGESKAHKDITEKYNVQWVRCAGAIWKLIKYGV